jgi:RNA polymerase sigma factor (sigma-70 family)
MQIYNNDDDNALIKCVKEFNDEEALKTLIQKHSPLCNSLYKKYSGPIISSGIFLDDLVNEKDYIIYKSALSYDPEKKSKFSTWLYNQVRYQCLNCINDNKAYIKVEDNVLNSLIEKNSNNKSNTNICDYINNIINHFSDKRIKDIFILRYSNSRKKMPWSKIAKKLNISTQTAINLHNKAIEKLKFKIKSKNTFDKI